MKQRVDAERVCGSFKNLLCVNMYCRIPRITWRMTERLMDHKAVDFIHYTMGDLKRSVFF